MSDHNWILENLAAYLTDGLESAERERLEQHTAECTTCAAALATARAADIALTALFVDARPASLGGSSHSNAEDADGGAVAYVGAGLAGSRRRRTGADWIYGCGGESDPRTR